LNHVRVLIADDDAHVRAAIRLLLEQEAGVSSVSECASVDQLVDDVARFHPDAVLIDWELPGLQPAQQHVTRVHAVRPETAVVALSCCPELRPQALRAGAASFVCKSDAPDKLVAILRNLGSNSTLDGNANVGSNTSVALPNTGSAD
jgi:DNA-binding NarL/FixJ family response regulator